MCEMDYDPITTSETSTCPSTHFCFVPPQTRSKSGRNAGHCCQIPPADGATVQCPIGVVTASCPDTSTAVKDALAGIRTCPYVSHDCVSYKYIKNQVCCANPCRASSAHFNVDGRCYEYTMVGKPCEIDAQCVGGSKCRPDNNGNFFPRKIIIYITKTSFFRS